MKTTAEAERQSLVAAGENGAKARTPSSRSFENLTRTAYEKIRAAIVYARFDLGEALSENGLAKGLGMSKAPVRGALSELRLNGLVEIVPQSGTYVFSPQATEIEKLCDFRYLLESAALKQSVAINREAFLAALRQVMGRMEDAMSQDNVLAFKRCDTEFHQSFIAHCDNQYLTAAYGNIQHVVEALRYRFMDTTVYRNKAFDEHRRIFELLQQNKVSKIIEILNEHISRTQQFQANVRWSEGRARRKDYHFRNYAEVFRD